METAAQAAALPDMGYGSAQGYHVAPPMTAEDFSRDYQVLARRARSGRPSGS